MHHALCSNDVRYFTVVGNLDTGSDDIQVQRFPRAKWVLAWIRGPGAVGTSTRQEESAETAQWSLMSQLDGWHFAPKPGPHMHVALRPCSIGHTWTIPVFEGFVFLGPLRTSP